MTQPDENHQACPGRKGWAGVEDKLMFVELALRAQGVRVDPDALTRVRRIMDGSLTREQARSEIAAKYGRELPDD